MCDRDLKIIGMVMLRGKEFNTEQEQIMDTLNSFDMKIKATYAYKHVRVLSTYKYVYIYIY